MGSPAGLVILSDLCVEFGNYDGQLPSMIEGKFIFLPESSGVQFSNNHNYVFSGVDYNYVKGYVCQCGEAFYGLGLALMHYTERFEQSGVSVCVNYANESCVQSPVSADEYVEGCNVGNHYKMSNMEVYADLESKLDSVRNQHYTSYKSNPDNKNDNQMIYMKDDADLDSKFYCTDDDELLNTATTSKRKLICECIFGSFGYNLQIQYRTELGKQLGVSADYIRYCMKSFANNKKESPFEEMLTPEVRSNAMNIHNKVVEQLETWTPETGYVDKHVVLLCAIHKRKGVNFDNSFRNACQTILGLTNHKTRVKCQKSTKDCRKMDALISKPHIKKEADILYNSICKQQEVNLQDKSQLVKRPFTDEKLIMNWIFDNKPEAVTHDLEYRRECAKILDVPFMDIYTWWKRARKPKKSRMKEYITKDIIKRGKLLHKKAKEAIRHNNVIPEKFVEPIDLKHLILEGIFTIYRHDLDYSYRRICAEKLRVNSTRIKKYDREAKIRKKAKTGDPFAHLITEDVLVKSREIHNFVIEKLEKMKENSKDIIHFGNRKVNRNRLILDCLSALHDHKQSISLAKEYVRQLGVENHVGVRWWYTIGARIRLKAESQYTNLITPEIMDLAKTIHESAVMSLNK